MRVAFLFLLIISVAVAQHQYTVVRKGDLIAIHSSAHTSPLKLPHIPLPQTSPPDCPIPKDPWTHPTLGVRIGTHADQQSRLTMFRRDSNNTLGQMLLGYNLQPTSFFLIVGQDQRLETACGIEVEDPYDACDTLEELHEYRTKTTWYLDGTPTMYTPLERERVNTADLVHVSSPADDMFLDEILMDTRREVQRDLDSFEYGFPTVPQDQPVSRAMMVWTHYHFRVYYRRHHIIDDVYQITGHEVVPMQPRYLPCEEELEQPYNITYSTVWIEHPASWGTRADMYLFHDKHTPEIQIGAIVLSTLLLLFFAAVMLSWVRYGIDTENKQMTEEHDVVSQGGWRSMGGDVFRPPRNANAWAGIMGFGAQCTSLILTVAATFVIMSLYVEVATSVAEIMVFTSAASFMLNGMFSVVWVRVARRKSSSQYVMDSEQAKMVVVTSSEVERPLHALESVWIGFSLGVLLFGLGFFWEQHLMAKMGSTAFLGMEAVISGLCMWFTMAMLFTGLGAACGWTFAKDVPPLLFAIPVIPRTIRIETPKFWGLVTMGTGMALACLIAGGAVVLTVLRSTWGPYVQAMYGLSGLGVVAYLGLCVLASLLFVFHMIKWEEYRWWWRAPAMSSASALALCFIVWFFIITGPVDHPVARELMYTEMVVACAVIFFALFFMTGSSSFFFVQFLYKNVKAD